jgi:hypothetical protein
MNIMSISPLQYIEDDEKMMIKTRMAMNYNNDPNDSDAGDTVIGQ